MSEYSTGEPEEEIVEVCPAAESLNVIDLALRWEAEFSGPSDRRAAQLLGQMADEGIAAATVRQFAELGSCDLDVMIPESVSSGGLVDVDGADAAATLLIEAESEGLRIELGAVAVGSTVAVFTLEGAGSADEVGAELLELMTLGVAKIAAG